ncbi:phosphoribosyltransferase family protein [Cellulomonas sp.]|uniref:phosphoribosyltransferase n=1 Tax=Cellulomonas sp. TaxID=40001 RepID=UPI00344DCEBA
MIVFTDRLDAGRQLATRLEHLRGQHAVVLGLPRGGVPVAFEVAQALDLPLDVIVVRKLGVPYQAELAMGAIGEGGARVLDARVLAATGVSAKDLAAIEGRERAELEERVARLRRGRDPVDLTGRIAVIVDDGIATGSTARVACEVARHLGAARVIVAVPVAPVEAARGLPGADEVVCVWAPTEFMAVGNHYRDFSPTSDGEVIVLLDAAARRTQGAPTCGDAQTATSTSRSPSARSPSRVVCTSPNP